MYKWAFFVRLIWVIFSIGKSGPFCFSCGLQIYFVYLSFIHWPVSDYLSFSSSVLSIILRKKKEKKWLESSDTFIFSLFVLRTFKGCSARTEQKITLVSSSATSSNSFSFQRSRSIVVWKMQLHLPRSHEKQKVHRTSKPNSFRKVWKNRNYDVVSWYGHSCYMWKIRLSVPGCSDRIDFTSVLVLRKTLISL